MRKEITSEELDEISAAYCNGKEYGHIGLIQAMSMSARYDEIYATVCTVKGYTIEYKVVKDTRAMKTDTLEQIAGFIQPLYSKDDSLKVAKTVHDIAIKSPEAQEYWRHHDYENDEVVQKWKQDIIKSPEAAEYWLDQAVGAIEMAINAKQSVIEAIEELKEVQSE